MIDKEDKLRREWHKVASAMLQELRRLKSEGVFIIHDVDDKGQTIGFSLTTVDPKSMPRFRAWIERMKAGDHDIDEREHFR